MMGRILMAVNNSIAEPNCKKKILTKQVVKTKSRLRESKKITQRKVETIHTIDTDSCLSIWQSVVVQAFYDIISEAHNYEQKIDRANAIAWFGQGIRADGRQTDFQTVCDLANLDVYAVMKLARKAIRGDKKKLISGFNFRTLRKGSSSRIRSKKSSD